MAGLCQAYISKEKTRSICRASLRNFAGPVGQLSSRGDHRYLLMGYSRQGGRIAGLSHVLGAYRNRVRAYASSQHLATVEAFVEDVQHAKSQGFTAYKIHPPWLAENEVDYKLDIEVAKAVFAGPAATAWLCCSIVWGHIHAMRQ